MGQKRLNERILAVPQPASQESGFSNLPPCLSECPARFPGHSMKIHPSATVSPRAEIAEDVVIGPGATVSEGVVLGRGCIVKARAVIEGHTILGEANVVGIGAILGAGPQDLAYEDNVQSGVRIGAGNTIGERVTIHRGTQEGSATIVGNQCHLLSGSHLGHNARLGNHVVVSNNCLLGGYVEVGDEAVLEPGSVFHQFIQVGRLARVSSNSSNNKDIPPYVVAFSRNFISGVNTSGLKNAGWPEERQREMDEAFRLVYASGLNVSQALEEARARTWSQAVGEFFDFIAGSRRGISSGRPGRKMAQVLPTA